MRRFLFWILVFSALFPLLAPAASAEGPATQPVLSPTQTFSVDPPAGLPRQYARLDWGVPIYKTLDDVVANSPSSWLGGPDTWVSVYAGAELEGKTYYLTGYGWMPGDAFRFAGSTTLHGVDLRSRPDERLGMIYWPHVNVRSLPGVLTPETLAGSLEGYDLVSILEERWVDGALWYRIGDNEWIHSKLVRHFTPAPRPSEIGPNEKWIEVNLREQTVIAHEGDTPVYATLASTGTPPRWPTVQGLFRIWIKLEHDRMQGGDTPADRYDLADVPWTMYFYRGYALHAAYWHDKFGAVRSHGCVNLSPVDARWFFEWADPVIPAGQTFAQATEETPSTWVWVHNG
ncbi:MAG: L,D-transpeptidase [Ardenticatenaceae bacterium]|nr:L,D-transpeptidase [Ardenticatenaceae bacterium]HBY93118.1 hypothetical protein [Chloroflexota bacterium]